MHDASDMDLLRDYVRQNSEAAFAGLVERHIALVYSAALRQTGIAAHAEEITQAVFILLARKAAVLRPDTILDAWLQETTRLTAWSFLRGERRRQSREQEAYMQSTLQDAAGDPVWNQLAPWLDEAISRLGQRDRQAVVLRYFKGKNLRDVAAALDITEAAAQRRVHRAVGKLQKFFFKRGIDSTTATIADQISAHSVQAAPVALAKAVTAVAIAKGATASISTLTLIKGALKIMVWTKAKTAIVVGVGVLLAAGTTTITIKEIQKHRDSLWELPNFDPVPMVAPAVLGKTPAQVRLVPSKYNHFVVGFTQGDGEQSISIGIGMTADGTVETAYGSDSLRTIFTTELPKSRYDYIANLPSGALQTLQEEIKTKLGLIGKWEVMETNVLVLKLANPSAQALKPATGLGNSLDTLRRSLENIVGGGLPVVDKTGLTNRYDFSFVWPRVNTSSAAGKKAIKDALYNQLGLELVPGSEPIEMLVVEKVK